MLYRLGQKEYRDTIASVQEKGGSVCSGGVVCLRGFALHLLICTICPLLLQHTLATSDRCLPSIWWLVTHIEREKKRGDTGKKGSFTFPKQGDRASSGLIQTTEETACENGMKYEDFKRRRGSR